MELTYYQGKTVLVTGHTGFKGTWLCEILVGLGAQVVGYALEPATTPNLFALSGIADEITSIIGDIRDYKYLYETIETYEPEVVFHLAAQPIVRTSYENPLGTYETNVMGTVHLCECIRKTGCVKSFVNITTDKVYENQEWEWGYREHEPLKGYDPYSNSKSCSELVTYSYKKSFFEELHIPVSTARAGNVIGGGDFSQDRIIPDCIRAVLENQSIKVRNPYSTRPYQHVLEPLFLYLIIGAKQAEDIVYADCYNVGPDECDCVTTGALVDLFSHTWGEGATWVNESVDGPHEANFLKLDCSKAKQVFAWNPKWHIDKAIEYTVQWTKVYVDGGNVRACMQEQIRAYQR
ncbi:MAG: CDP-glucose 4,6-dehydratase [Eubacteriales bacterium]